MSKDCLWFVCVRKTVQKRLNEAVIIFLKLNNLGYFETQCVSIPTTFINILKS
jgi:hypothetical protein